MRKISTLILLSLLLTYLPAPQSLRAQQNAKADDEITVKLKGVDGKTYDIADMKGNVLLVSFGATWCQPCYQELQALEELKKEYQDKPVKFMWVSIEREDEISDGKLRAFAKSLKLSFPVLRDTTKFTFAQFSARVRIPLVVFFDREGRYVKPAHVGMATPEVYKEKMRGVIDRLLEN